MGARRVRHSGRRKSVRVTVKASIRVVEWDRAETGMELLARADLRLYANKYGPVCAAPVFFTRITELRADPGIGNVDQQLRGSVEANCAAPFRRDRGIVEWGSGHYAEPARRIPGAIDVGERTDMLYDQLVIDETRGGVIDDAEAAELLAAKAWVRASNDS